MKFLCAIALCAASPIVLATEPPLKVNCTAPYSITHIVQDKGELYESTYKLFDGKWEEIDTESPRETIPEHLQSTNAQLHSEFKKACRS